jgi:hypothetical protein
MYKMNVLFCMKHVLILLSLKNLLKVDETCILRLFKYEVFINR